MKTSHCILIATCVILAIAVASLKLYIGLPELREFQCKELAAANQPRSDYPFLAQGILLSIGTLFFFVVTALAEWKKGNKAKWNYLLTFQALVLIGVCFTLWASSLLSLLWSTKITQLSPSFVDACQPDPPVNALCGSHTSLETKVNVNCTTDPIRWIPALSQSYPPMITLQTFMMIASIVWMSIAKYDFGLASAFFMGMTVMGLLLGIGMSAIVNNEAAFWTTVVQFVFGAIISLIYWCFGLKAWAHWVQFKKTDNDDPELQRHFDDSSTRLQNPVPLQPGLYTVQMNPALDVESPPPSYYSLFVEN